MRIRFPTLSVPIWLSTLFVFVVAVRLILLMASSIYPLTTTLEPRDPDSGWDSGEYIRYAKNMAFHGTFSHSENAPFHPSAFRTPVYPLFLAAFFRLASSDTQALLWITLAQICLAGVSALLLYAIAVRLTGNKLLSWAAAAIASLDLYSIRLNHMVTAEPLFITLLLTTTLVFLRYLESSRLIYLAGSMILLVVTGLCRPLALYFLPVFLFFVIWRQITKVESLELSVESQKTGNKVESQQLAIGNRQSAIGNPLIPLLLALAVFALALAPWVLRNWSTMHYLAVYTNGSYMNAFLANGLLTVERTGDPIPFLKIRWTWLDQVIEDSLAELSAETGTKVTYDANIPRMLVLDHPRLTKRFAAIIQSKADQVLRENRLNRLTSSLATFVVMPFWTPKAGVLCMILGEKGTSGLSEIVRAHRQHGWRESCRLLSELKFCKVLGYPWTYGYLICLNALGLIGLVSIQRSVFPPSEARLAPEGGRVRGSGFRVLNSSALRRIRRGGHPSSFISWTFLAVMPFLLMAAPSWGTAVGWEMARFRAPAIPFIAIFAVMGFAFIGDRIRAHKQGDLKR